MRRALLTLILFFTACTNDPGADESSTSGSSTGDELGCMLNTDCGPGNYCLEGQCEVIECYGHSTDCGEGEYCWANKCLPKGEAGDRCAPEGVDTAHENGCLSGLCGRVADSWRCVDPCEWEDTQPFAPYQCSEGFVCVGPGNVQGATNSHYCWPEGSGDYLDIGEPCGTPGHDKEPCAETGTCAETCASAFCGSDNVCRWPCGVGLVCPEGLACEQPDQTFWQCM